MDETGTGCRAEEASPLSDTTARISGLADYLNSWIGIPAEPGWFRLADLGRPELLAAWHDDVHDRVSDRRVAAAYMSNWLLSCLVGGMVMPVIADRRLPLASHADTAVRRTVDGWFDALAVDDDAAAVLPDDLKAGHPTAVVMGETELFEALATKVLALSPIITALHAACPIGLPALWGAVADAIGSSTLQLTGLMERNRASSWEDANLLIGIVSGRQPRMRTAPRPFAVEHRGETRFFEVRGTCCLYYRTVENPDREGAGYCTSCPLRTDDARMRILVEWLDGTAANG